MATTVTLAWEGEMHRDSDAPSRGARYIVTFDRNPSPLAACHAHGIPRWRDVLAGSGMVVIDVEARCFGGPLCFEVNVTYGLLTDEKGEKPEITTAAVAPWNRPWSIAVGTQAESLPYDVDVDGTKVANSAGSPFDPPDQREETDLVITVVRNHQTFDLTLARDYNNSTNDDVFLGYAKGAVRVNIVGEFQREGPWSFWRVTYTLRLRYGLATDQLELLSTFDARIADRGYQEKVGVKADGKPDMRAIKNGDGGPVSEPALLNGEGRAAKDGAKTTWLKFKRYPRKPYAKLGLETAIKRALTGKMAQAPTKQYKDSFA